MSLYTYIAALFYNRKFAFSVGRYTGRHVPQRLHSRLCETPRHKSDVPRGWLRCLHRGCGNQGENNGCEFLPRANINL